MARTVSIEFPSLYPKQYEAIFCSKRYVLIESGTKTGKTIGCAIWIASKTLEEDREGDISWWIAPTYEQTRLGFQRVRALFPPNLIKVSESRLSVELPNGALILFKTGEKPDNLFGAAVKRAVVDEASRLREEAMFALRTTMTQTRGPIRFIGNPKGRRNWFWRWCQKAKQDLDPEASYFHLATVDNPHISREEIEDARQRYPPSVFAELYEGIPVEDGAGVFRRFRDRILPNCLQPPIPSRPYVGGLDLARLQDYTVLIILDAITRQVVFMDRFNEINWNLQIARIKSAQLQYNLAPIMVDATAMGGDALYEQLTRSGVIVEPYKLSGQSKEHLIEALAIAFEQGSIGIPDDRELLHELEMFEYNLSDSGRVIYKAPDGHHDDIVIALAFANLLAERSGYMEHIPPTMSKQIEQDFGYKVEPTRVEYWVAKDLKTFLARKAYERNMVEV